MTEDRELEYEQIDLYERVEYFVEKSFKGTQNGYQVSFASGTRTFTFKHSHGYRGIRIPVTIRFDDVGFVSVVVDL